MNKLNPRNDWIWIVIFRGAAILGFCFSIFIGILGFWLVGGGGYTTIDVLRAPVTLILSIILIATNEKKVGKIAFFLFYCWLLLDFNYPIGALIKVHGAKALVKLVIMSVIGAAIFFVFFLIDKKCKVSKEV